MKVNLKKRIITALLIYPIIALLILFSNDLVIRLLLYVIIFLSTFEISKMCFQNGINKKYHYFFIGLVFYLIFLSNGLIMHNIWHYFVILSFVSWIFIAFYIIKHKNIVINNNFNIFFLFLCALILGSLYCSLLTLYLLSPILLLYLISLIVISDISAFFIGKKIGKNSFFKNISPNKTKEGFYGSIFTSSVFSLIFCLFQNYSYEFIVEFILLSITVVVFSAVGDLSVSLIKRYSGNKDSGNILPGHGGILDRIDSLLPAAPIFLIFSYFLTDIIK